MSSPGSQLCSSREQHLRVIVRELLLPRGVGDQPARLERQVELGGGPEPELPQAVLQQRRVVTELVDVVPIVEVGTELVEDRVARDLQRRSTEIVPRFAVVQLWKTVVVSPGYTYSGGQG